MAYRKLPKPEPPTEEEISTYVKPDVLVPVPLPEPPPEPPPALPIPIYIGDLTDEELLYDQKKFEKKISTMFPPEFVETIKRLSYYLSTVGLDFAEACMMIRFDPKDMALKIKEFPIIQELIDFKELEYKVSLIKAVSKKAVDGDDKLAQWLLERRFPNEFNPKKGSGTIERDPGQELAAVVEFIQRSNDSTPLIKETAGRAFVFKRNSNEDIITAVNQVLR